MEHEMTATAMVSTRVREVRNQRGWSAEHVAKLCADAGRSDINRSVIANLENDRKAKVAIDDVLVLAHVLGVPPVLLFTPVGTRHPLRVTPTTTLPAASAMLWASGWSAEDDEITRAVRFTWEVARLVLQGKRPEAADVARSMELFGMPVDDLIRED